MVKKQSIGRQKIEIKKIKEESSLQVTFAKRRKGLVNKAAELCILCGAEVAVLGFSPRDKPFAFGACSSADAIIERYLGENTDRDRIPGTDHKAEGCKKEYVEAAAALEAQKKQVEMMTMMITETAGRSFWWDEPIEDMGVEELDHYLACMGELKKNIHVRIDEMEKAVHSPSGFLALDAELTVDAPSADGNGARTHAWQ